jgi:hypothetical protein
MPNAIQFHLSTLTIGSNPMQSFDVCDDGLVGKSTVVRKQSADFRVSTPLVTGTNIAVAGSSCSRGAETGAFDAGPSTIALTFDSPLLTLTHQKLPVKQLCSPFPTETDFHHVRIGV